MGHASAAETIPLRRPRAKPTKRPRPCSPWLTVSRVPLAPLFDESNGRRNRLIPEADQSFFPGLWRVDNPNPMVSFDPLFDVVLNSPVLHGTILTHAREHVR